MSRYVARLDSTYFPVRLLTTLAICLFFCLTPLMGSADDEIVATASTKSTGDEKPPIDEAHPLYKLLQVAYKSRAALDDVTDYTCIFTKREMLRTKLLKTTMALKLREAPFSVYLKFLDLNEGREVIYVKGKNDNNLLVHEAGVKSFLGTFPIPPTSTDALAENKYPVTSIGLRNMIETIIKLWENEGKYAGITVTKYENSKGPSGELCTAYEVVHKQFKEFKFHTTRLYVDDATGIAVGVQQLSFPRNEKDTPPISEEYFYTKLKTNQKLTDLDFDPKNRQYTFR